MERVTVPVPGRSYDVVVGSGVAASLHEHLPDLRVADRAFVVADRDVADRWFETLRASLANRGLTALLLAVPPGEEAKTLQVYGTVLHQLAIQEAHRDDLVVSLGGGTTSDLAGFVAATYMRGVPLVHLPTTLTAQVDAAVGGKTGVNLPEGKNLVGAFYQPLLVAADIDALATLEDDDFRAGLAEVAKYGLTLDLGLLAQLEEDPGPVLSRDPDALEALVVRCIRAKADTVAVDERDLGRRMVLNYGHTIGHALERLDGFAGRTHGDAISVGMVFASKLAESRGMAPQGLTRRTKRLLASLGIDVHGPIPPAGDVIAALHLDKKFSAGVRFVLLEDVGRPVVVEGVGDDELRAILEEMGAER